MNRRIVFLGSISTVTVCAIAGYWIYQLAEDSYQSWADCERLKHLVVISSLVEEFKGIKGYYPFGESYLVAPEEGYVHVPASVNITQRPLPDQYKYPPPGRSGIVYSTEQMEEELSNALNRAITLPSDPQNVPVWAPNFYQYMIYPDGNYYFSVSLYESRKYTRELSKHYHEYTIGSLVSSEPNAKIDDPGSAKVAANE